MLAEECRRKFTLEACMLMFSNCQDFKTNNIVPTQIKCDNLIVRTLMFLLKASLCRNDEDFCGHNCFILIDNICIESIYHKRKLLAVKILWMNNLTILVENFYCFHQLLY